MVIPGKFKERKCQGVCNVYDCGFSPRYMTFFTFPSRGQVNICLALAGEASKVRNAWKSTNPGIPWVFSKASTTASIASSLPRLVMGSVGGPCTRRPRQGPADGGPELPPERWLQLALATNVTVRTTINLKQQFRDWLQVPLYTLNQDVFQEGYA